MIKFTILTPDTLERVAYVHADSETEALDNYAAEISGYCTMSQMARSAVFRHYADVIAVPAA